jgi:hypothetical protein
VLEKTGGAVELKQQAMPLLPFRLPSLPISSALAATASGGAWAGGGAEEELWRSSDGGPPPHLQLLPPLPVLGADTRGGLKQGTTTAVPSKGARTLGCSGSGTVVGPAKDGGAPRSSRSRGDGT